MKCSSMNLENVLRIICLSMFLRSQSRPSLFPLSFLSNQPNQNKTCTHKKDAHCSLLPHPSPTPTIPNPNNNPPNQLTKTQKKTRNPSKFTARTTSHPPTRGPPCTSYTPRWHPSPGSVRRKAWRRALRAARDAPRGLRGGGPGREESLGG